MPKNKFNQDSQPQKGQQDVNKGGELRKDKDIDIKNSNTGKPQSDSKKR